MANRLSGNRGLEDLERRWYEGLNQDNIDYFESYDFDETLRRSSALVGPIGLYPYGEDPAGNDPGALSIAYVDSDSSK
jgi:hypothetical protein